MGLPLDITEWVKGYYLAKGSLYRVSSRNFILGGSWVSLGGKLSCLGGGGGGGGKKLPLRPPP